MLPLMASTTPKAYFGAAVVSGSRPGDPAACERGFEKVPTVAIAVDNPALQVPQHGSFIAVGPQPLQAFFRVGFHHRG